jgi:hypothetical protein
MSVRVELQQYACCVHQKALDILVRRHVVVPTSPPRDDDDSDDDVRATTNRDMDRETTDSDDDAERLANTANDIDNDGNEDDDADDTAESLDVVVELNVRVIFRSMTRCLRQVSCAGFR